MALVLPAKFQTRSLPRGRAYWWALPVSGSILQIPFLPMMRSKVSNFTLYGHDDDDDDDDDTL